MKEVVENTISLYALRQKKTISYNIMDDSTHSHKKIQKKKKDSNLKKKSTSKKVTFD